MPLSANTIFSPGWRTGMSENSQSAAGYTATSPNSRAVASLGASEEVVGKIPPEPVCRHTTVSVSSQAAQRSFQ
jgi:hypothetical protein